MPRDVGGNYTLPAGNPVVPNTIIATNWANTTMQDIADALTASLSIDGSVTTAKIADDAVTRAKLNGLDANGVVTAISATEFEARVITGTSGEVTVTNGDGVAADPTISLAAEVYKRANILGSVSQSAGVPTGAIIESGSNANGSYVKFANGTMICVNVIVVGTIAVAYGNIFRSASVTWTFPVPFIAFPVVSVREQSGNGFVWGGLGSGADTLTDTSIALFAGLATAGSSVASVIAIGEWF